MVDYLTCILEPWIGSVADEPSEDHRCMGITQLWGEAGESLGLMDLCILYESDGLWYQADADAEIDTNGLLGICSHAVNVNDKCYFVLPPAVVRDDTYALTKGNELYVSLVAGQPATAPPATPDFVRWIGHAISDDAWWFWPENRYEVGV